MVCSFLCILILNWPPGCKYVDQHTVITPPGYKEAYAQYCEAGWQSLGYPAEFGGQGMPQSLVLFHSEILVSVPTVGYLT